MALTVCPECNGSVSGHAPHCVHCGFPFDGFKDAKSELSTTDSSETNYGDSSGARKEVNAKSSKRTFVIFAFAFAVASGIAFIFSPPHIKSKFAEIAFASSIEQQCFSFHKSRVLHDPWSAYIDESRLELPSGGMPDFDSGSLTYTGTLHLKVKAKNLMGAYKTEYLECRLMNGVFDEHTAIMDYYKR